MNKCTITAERQAELLAIYNSPENQAGLAAFKAEWAKSGGLTTLSKLAKGDYVRLTKDGPVWVKGHYDRSSKSFSLSKADDMNAETFRKGATQVWAGFTY
jgi:hypothetical protein